MLGFVWRIGNLVSVKSKLSEVFFELHGVYSQLQHYFFFFFLFFPPHSPMMDDILSPVYLELHLHVPRRINEFEWVPGALVLGTAGRLC